MSIVHLVSPFCRLTPRTGNLIAAKTEKRKPNSKLRSLHLVYGFFKIIFLRTQLREQQQKPGVQLLLNLQLCKYEVLLYTVY